MQNFLHNTILPLLLTNTTIFNTGIAPKDLALHPTDKHFFRLAKLIGLAACSSLVDILRVPTNIWKDLKTTFANKTTHTKFFALCEWRKLKYQQNSEPTFQELFAALPEKEDTHFLCQVGRNCRQR